MVVLPTTEIIEPFLFALFTIFYNKIGFIIPMVVLPTTEIIEPFSIATDIRQSA